MKLPEKFKDGTGSQDFRKTNPLTYAIKVVNLDKSENNHREIIDIRFYESPETNDEGYPVLNCVIWIRDDKNNNYGWAMGKTEGYGYHMESAALHGAFLDLGITFEKGEDFNAAGDDAMKKGIKTLASCLGYNNVYLCTVTAG